jgi:predicted transcriptional regulator
MRACRWRNLVGLGLISLLLLNAILVPQPVKAEWEIDYILIRDAPNGGGLEVGNRTYITGENDTYYAAGYNNTTGYVKDVLAGWWTEENDIIELLSWKESTNVTITALEYGVGKVNAVTSPVNGSHHTASTGNLTVISDVDYIILRNESDGGGEWFGDTTIIGETTFTIYSAGYNSTRGYLRDVPVFWSSTNDSMCRPVVMNGTKWRQSAIYIHGEGICIITGTYSPGVLNSTGKISIISNIDYIVIRDSPDGGGLPVGNIIYTMDQNDFFYAAGYNHTLGYLRDFSVFWTSSDDSVCLVTSKESSRKEIDFAGDGSCSVTANYSWLLSNSTGTITVIFDIDYMIIRDQEAGGGQPMFGETLWVDQLYRFWTAGYNYTDGFRRDLKVEWFNSNTTVCKRDWGSEKGYGIRAWVPGICEISATFESRLTNDTGNITVLLDVDYFVIRDSPSGGGSVVSNETLYTYFDYSLYATGYNHTTGYVRDLTEITWSSTNESICYAWGDGEVRLLLPGNCNITADFRGVFSNTTGELTILFDVDYITIRDQSGGLGNPLGNFTYFTGEIKSFYAAGYNHTLGYRADLQSTWSSSNTSVCSVSTPAWPARYAKVRFYYESVCNVSASYRDWVTNSTGNLTVEWDIDYLVIMDDWGGNGVPIGDRTYLLSSSDYFFTAGYNYSLGYRRDLTPSWKESNSTVCWGSGYPDGRFWFVAGSVGFCRISSTYLGRLSNSTGNLTILSEIDYIIVRDGPEGSGNWVGDGKYSITANHDFYAAGYNDTRGFIEDVFVYWTTNNSASCGLTYDVSNDSIIAFEAKAIGYCQVTANYHGIHFNSTGLLQIVPRPIILVDDDGGGNYTTIREALEEAPDGAIIRVLNGTYYEHLLVNKTVTIEGLNKSKTWVNGSGYGTVFLVTADNVRISGLTIESSEYGIFLDRVKYASIDHNTIQFYDYGVYSNFSERTHIEKNLVTEGSNGIVTNYSDNDAVWHNEISYNDVYGAKDYESELSKCFNWNYFHHNKIAYYYDPDQYLEPLLLDSNLFEDNEIAILVEDASSIHITNNTVLRGEKGISILNGSPFIGNNSISGVVQGIVLRNSSSFVLGNEIVDSVIGITVLGKSPRIEMNVVRNSSELALELEGVVNASVNSNDFGDGQVKASNSTLVQVQVRNESLTLINTTWVELEIVGESILEVKWWVQLEILSEDGSPIQGANVRVTDVQGSVVAEFLSNEYGLSPWLSLTQQKIDKNGTLDLSNYRVDVEVNGVKRQFELQVDSNEFHSIYFRSITEDDTWLLYFAATLALVILGLVSTFSVERSRYAILAMFLIFYVKLKKKDVLGQFTRGRIMGYIEANPGAHFGAVRKALSLSNGNAVHHLRVLEDRGLVSSKNDGMYKRFYPKGAVLPPDDGAPLPEIYQRVLSCIKGAPGISQKEIANLLGLHQSTLEYQLKKLVKADLIRRERIGRRACYFPKKRKKK